jgi:hypothetical protein
MLLLCLKMLFPTDFLKPGPKPKGRLMPEVLFQVPPWAGETGISPPDAYPLLDQVLEGRISHGLIWKLKLDGQAISFNQFPENIVIDPAEAAAVRMPPCVLAFAPFAVVPGFGIIGTAWGRATIEYRLKFNRLPLGKLAAPCLCSLYHS